MIDEDRRRAEIPSSNTGQMAQIPSVENSQKKQFVADGAGHGASKQGVSVYSTAGSEVFDKSRKVSSSPDVLVNLPAIQSPQRKHSFSSLDSEESVYLAVYLNNRMLTEVIEAKEKDGSVYFKLKEIAILFESTPPEDIGAIATSEALEKMYPAKFNYSKNFRLY